MFTNILEEYSAAIFTSTMNSTRCHDPKVCSLKLADMDTLTFRVFHFKSRGKRSGFAAYHTGFFCDEMDLSSRGVRGYAHKNGHSSKILLNFVQMCIQCIS
jgi:hypothetical protein